MERVVVLCSHLAEGVKTLQMRRLRCCTSTSHCGTLEASVTRKALHIFVRGGCTNYAGYAVKD